MRKYAKGQGQKRRADDDADLLRATALLDTTADTFDEFMCPAQQFLEASRPALWLAKQRPLRDQWMERWTAARPAPPAQGLIPVRAFQGYQSALFQECTKSPWECERRILDVQGVFGVGKSTWVRQIASPAFWDAMDLTYPGVMLATALDTWKHFLQAYRGQRHDGLGWSLSAYTDTKLQP